MYTILRPPPFVAVLVQNKHAEQLVLLHLFRGANEFHFALGTYLAKLESMEGNKGTYVAEHSV